MGTPVEAAVEVISEAAALADMSCTDHLHKLAQAAAAIGLSRESVELLARYFSAKLYARAAVRIR